MVRPREWDRFELRERFFEYIEATDIPVVLEFAYTHGVNRQRLYEWPEIADALEMCQTKKEANLERKGLMGEVNIAMAIFSLKQMGWSDRAETLLRGDSKAPIVISQTAAKW